MLDYVVYDFVGIRFDRLNNDGSISKRSRREYHIRDLSTDTDVVIEQKAHRCINKLVDYHLKNHFGSHIVLHSDEHKTRDIIPLSDGKHDYLRMQMILESRDLYGLSSEIIKRLNKKMLNDRFKKY